MRQDVEACHAFQLLDNAQSPTPLLLFDPIQQLSAVPTIRPDQSQTGNNCLDCKKYQLSPIPVLNARLVNNQPPDQSQRIYEKVALAAFDFFTGIVALMPPFDVVFTDWLSMTPAVGVGRFPAFFLTSLRNVSWICSIVPSKVHSR